MSMKDLKPASSKSQLETFYRAAHRDIFGHDMRVKDDNHSSFTVMEDDLRSLGIAPKDYAYTVVTMLKRWALDKHMNFIPINTFCSDWVLKKARKILESSTINIVSNDNEDVLIHAELTVARAYLDRNKDDDVVRLGDVVDDIKSLLPKEWLDLYNNRRKRPTGKVLDMLINELGISQPVSNYADIADILRYG